MAFIVEDGTGKTDATAYVAIATVNAYATLYDHAQKTAFAAAAQGTQELHIIRATRALDIRWLQGRCIEDPFTADQSLYFPTNSFDDNRNRAVAADEIPACLENACCYLALQSFGGDLLLPVNHNPGLTKRSWRNESEGGSEEFDSEIPQSDWKEYPTVNRLLEPILHYGIRVEQG